MVALRAFASTLRARPRSNRSNSSFSASIRTTSVNNAKCCASISRARVWSHSLERISHSHFSSASVVITTREGAAIDPRNATRHFHKMLRDAGLTPVRFHDLRQTAATLLHAQGVDPRTIMEILGHSQISLTLNTYTHVLPALQRDAARQMDRALRG